VLNISAILTEFTESKYRFIGSSPTIGNECYDSE